MKNNTPPASESAAPLSLKLTLIGGGILVMVMLISATCSIVRVFRSSSSSPAAMQTNMEIAVVHLKPSEGIPLSSPSDNFGAQRSPNLSPLATASFSSSRPATFAGPNENAELRKQARIAALEERRRELAYAPIEIREQHEKERKAMIESAKQELLEQAGTSGVPKEVLQKLEQSDPIPF